MSTTDLLTIHEMGRHGGAFVRALARTALLADPENLERIKAAWPELWAKYAHWPNNPPRSAHDSQIADLH